MAVSYAGNLVVIGGWLPSPSDPEAVVSDQVYVLRNGAWDVLPSLRHPRAAGAAAVVGNQIVVVGGQANHQLVTQTEVFDGKRWRDAKPMPTPRDHLAAASDGHYLYAVGGWQLAADHNQAAVERYDPSANSWQKLPDLPHARAGLGAAIVGNRLIALGGENTTAALGYVEALDLTSNGWTSLPPMPTPRHGMAVAALDNRVYVIGGSATAGHMGADSTNEVLDFS
jgi:non-specific serine/threonine protein kinase